MASTLAPLPPIPVASQPVINPKTGLMDPNWYTWAKAVTDHIRDIERRLTAGSL